MLESVFLRVKFTTMVNIVMVALIIMAPFGSLAMNRKTLQESRINKHPYMPSKIQRFNPTLTIQPLINDIDLEEMRSLFRKVIFTGATGLDLSKKNVTDEAMEELASIIKTFPQLRILYLKKVRASTESRMNLLKSLSGVYLDVLEYSDRNSFLIEGLWQMDTSLLHVNKLVFTGIQLPLQYALNTFFRGLGKSGVTNLDISGLTLAPFDRRYANIVSSIRSIAESFKSTEIKHLNMSSGFITFVRPLPLYGEAIRDMLSALSHLESLTMETSNIDAEHLKFVLSGLNKNQIKYLNLNRNSLTNNAYKTLVDFMSESSLETLIIRKNAFTDGTTIKDFSSRLVEAKNLKILDIGENHIGEHGMAILLNDLRGSNIEELYIDKTQLNEKILYVLAQVLPTLKKLRVLDISVMRISNFAPLNAFADALKDVPSLQRLVMKYVFLPIHEGTNYQAECPVDLSIKFFESLPKTSITELNLGGCTFGRRGARYLIDTLPQTQITWLDISKVGIEDTFSNVFANIGATKLSTLIAKNNYFVPSSIQTSLFKKDSPLVHLDLSVTYDSRFFKQLIPQLASSRIETLVCEYCNLPKDMAVTLIDNISKIPLKHLNLNYNRDIMDEDLARMLNEKNQLQTLIYP